MPVQTLFDPGPEKQTTEKFFKPWPMITFVNMDENLDLSLPSTIYSIVLIVMIFFMMAFGGILKTRLT